MEWFKKSTQSEMPQRLRALQEWMNSGAGEFLLQAERSHIEHELKYIFGYHAVELSVSPTVTLLSGSQVNRNFQFHPLSTEPAPSLMMDLNHWPVAPGSLDLVLLHHMLEVSDRPHRLLSEAGHTIIPGGKMMVVGFNPLSLCNIKRVMFPGYRKLFSGVQFISPSRMRDWLTLLGFSVEKVLYGGYLLPSGPSAMGLKSELIEQRCRNWMLPFGSFYIIVATREVPGMTPVKPVWSSLRQPLVGNPITGSSRMGDNR
ncbi:methyltransferase domain-containing protein [Endozoicomonas sp. 4G]|uniref:methyltransferase domain-containing protein n=1 Tax=Endozoicomonas sp. 4G TaxID=2872754 RepID=UPI002078B229|nr:methyltransferase domain-containing protein [Endozoicomonas sp. 4G]